MVLKELEIQGFKSFPDRTKVTIRPGITAVVGPNGSGKSNISDALRWVLGETSAKQLRGAGKMENVIFGGTQMRGAMGFAAVTLRIDNTDRRLEIDSDEVAIGRRYYRSGESEYTINGQNVRLKDVYELLLDTGMGRDGYSIIGQGRIAEIVAAKSGERREIFEEASGIAKYRYRKNEAQRRLAATEDNLERLRDILGELESRVGPLKRDSEKAERFLLLSNQKKELEVTLWVENIRRAKETVREQQRRYENAQADYQRLSDEIQKMDDASEESRLKIQQLTVDVENLNTRIRAITQEMSGSESRIAVLDNDLKHNENTIAGYREELRQSSAGEQTIRQEIEDHRQKARELEQQLAALEEEITSITQKLEEIQAQNQETGERRGQVTAQMAQLTQQQTNAQVASAGAQAAAAAAAERMEAARLERQSQEEQTRRLEQEKEENTRYLEQLSGTVTRLENIKGGLSLKLESRKRSLEAADQQEQKITREMDSAHQRLNLLRDLEKNMDGYQSSVKTVMKAAQAGRLRGIIGPVSGILTVKPGYEVAIETALGFALQNIVVEGENAAKAAISFLKEERAGRATFLPLDTVKGQRHSGPLPEGAVLAVNLVEYDSRYEGIAASLLGRIVVVEDLNQASRAARALNYRNRVVTVDGQVINAGGSFTGGSTSKSAGLFSRRQEIQDLKQKIETLTGKQAKAQEETDRWKEEVDELSAQLTATDSELITANQDKIRAEMEDQRLAAALTQYRGAVQLLEGELEQLERQLEENKKIREESAAQEKELSAQLKKLEEELSALVGKDDNFLTSRQQLSEALSAKRLEQLSTQKDRESQLSAIESLEGRTGENAQRALELEQAIAKMEELNRENRRQVEEIRESCRTSQGEISSLEGQIQETNRQRMELEAGQTEKTQQVRTITSQREQMGQEMARLAERKEQAEGELEQTVTRLWEEYQLTQSAAQELCVEFENVTELRRQVTELRNRIRGLGNVNVGAIEEYKEVSQRYETLSTQVSDVEKSKNELNRLIAQLSGEMKEIFSENFKTINQNFARIFKELFGGGTASLSLSDPEDVLESGIDIQVAPPGKVIKNLSALSGGEQTLVAISIYFAILAVNPSPFCVLDEIEAALDDVNVVRFAQYLRRISDKTQFVVITHRRGTMEAADVLYGVTMQEDGVSKLLKLELDQVDAKLIT